eukprot:scaffold2792_cov112-Isochrysis_galbana.AAC.6
MMTAFATFARLFQSSAIESCATQASWDPGCKVVRLLACSQRAGRISHNSGSGALRFAKALSPSSEGARCCRGRGRGRYVRAVKSEGTVARAYRLSSRAANVNVCVCGQYQCHSSAECASTCII